MFRWCNRRLLVGSRAGRTVPSVGIHRREEIRACDPSGPSHCSRLLSWPAAARPPALSLLVVDPEDTGRYLQIRGDGELVHQGAIEHLDILTRAYTRHPCFYGHVYPREQRERETRVIVRVRARRITVDAIH